MCGDSVKGPFACRGDSNMIARIRGFVKSPSPWRCVRMVAFRGRMGYNIGGGLEAGPAGRGTEQDGTDARSRSTRRDGTPILEVCAAARLAVRRMLDTRLHMS
jgi:hypothetical protein